MSICIGVKLIALNVAHVQEGSFHCCSSTAKGRSKYKPLKGKYNRKQWVSVIYSHFERSTFLHDARNQCSDIDDI